MPKDTGSADVDIDLPIYDVFQQWTRFETYPLFVDAAVEVAQLSSTVLHWRVAFAGLERDFDAVIVERVPQRLLTWRSLGPRVHVGSVAFAALGDSRTRVTLSMEWDHRLLASPVAPRSLTCDARVGADLDIFAQMMQNGSLGRPAPRLIGLSTEHTVAAEKVRVDDSPDVAGTALTGGPTSQVQ